MSKALNQLEAAMRRHTKELARERAASKIAAASKYADAYASSVAAVICPDND